MKNWSTSLDASTLSSRNFLGLPAARGRDEALQAFTAGEGAFDTVTSFGATGSTLDCLVEAEITAVGTGVDDSAEGHGGEEEGSEAGEELHFD